MKKHLLILCISILSITTTIAQNVGISSTGAVPANSAGLDVNFPDKGLLIPRVALSATNLTNPIPAPATSLLIYNTATASAGATAVSPGYYYWTGTQWARFFDATDGRPWVLEGNSGTSPGTDFLGTTDVQALVFKTSNIERMRILSGGYVGIGLTVPTQRFQVNGNVYASGGDFYTAAGNGVINCGGGIMNPNVNIISDGIVNLDLANGDEDLYIYDDLEVDDDVRIEGGIDDGAGYGTNGYVLVTNGFNNITWTDPATLADDDWKLTGNAAIATNFIGTTNAIDFRIFTSNLERMTIEANGNVGIGTTAPIYGLHVNGTTTMGTILISPNEIGSGDDSEIRLAEDHDGSYGSIIRYDGGTNQTYFYGYSGATLYGPHITINRNTPTRVGIGTTTPSEELDVIGEIEFSGSLEPNALPGTSGQALLSAGANTAPTWGVNLGNLTEISRWYYPPININSNTTYTITANIPGVTNTSSVSVNLSGDWITSPGNNITIHHVEARTGQVRFIVQNNTLWTNYLNMDFIINVIR